MMRWIRKESRANLILALVSLFGTLLLVEMCLRWIGPKNLRMRRNENSYHSFTWNETNTQFDEELGFITRPNLDVVFENTEYKTTVRTNSWGFRDDETSLTDPQILLIGDSFLFGWGVEEEETATSVLEELTGQTVLNMGVACYGTIQQFLLLQRYCEVNDVTGCTVVFLYYLNDRIENGPPPGELVPTVRKDGRRIVFTPADEETYDACMKTMAPTLMTTLSSHSAVLDLIVGSFFNPRRELAFKGYFESDRWESSKGQFPGFPVGQFEVLEYLIRVLKLYAEERSFQVKFVLLPFLENFENNKKTPDYRPEKQVLRMLEVPYRDLTDDFTREDFFPIDRHLTPEGQEKLGEGIAEFLLEQEL